MSGESLILSLFGGIGMLDRGFEEEGFCVVRGPDLLWCRDIRAFHPPSGYFHGVLGGPPCQGFSKANRNPAKASEYGLEMLLEFARVVTLAGPEWWLIENVPGCPTLVIPGWETQRLDLNALECGLAQRRHRHIQFGSSDGRRLAPMRIAGDIDGEPTCMASEGRRANRRDWSRFCALQGLTPAPALSHLTRQARYTAVGNGVPVPMARTIARAVKNPVFAIFADSLCACGCGRVTRPGVTLATDACRQRASRRTRFGDRIVTYPG
jgi:DNA (cytosine-5)-methyltransferase 1